MTRTGAWVGGSFAATLGVAAAMIVARGAGDGGVHLALFATARLMFLLFWLAYAGSALATLFGPVFQPLRQRGREFGLAFAAALSVHLGLVAWVCWLGGAPPFDTFVFFGVGVGWTYLITLFSIAPLQRALGPHGWWVLRAGGMNYVLYAFASDFLADSSRPGLRHAVEYWPFIGLVVAGPALRLAAIALRSWRSPAYRAVLASAKNWLAGRSRPRFSRSVTPS